MEIKFGVKDQDIVKLFQINEESYPPHLTESREDLESKLKQGFVWTAEVNGNIVGFINVILKDRQPYIWNVAVLPSFRRQGIASRLINVAVTYFEGRKFRNIRLHVQNSNPAQKVYFDIGFRVRDIQFEYYGPLQPALIMVKEL